MPAGKVHNRRNKSLCERSTKIAMNIIKASSLALAKITLGSLGPPGRSTHVRVAEVPPPPLPPSSFSDLRSKQLRERGSLATSYVMEPDDGDDGLHKGVDGRAEDYIARFRERNRSDLSVQSEVSDCIPPPPKSAIYRS